MTGTNQDRYPSDGSATAARPYTDVEIAAAKLRVELDESFGVETPAAIRDAAQFYGEPGQA